MLRKIIKVINGIIFVILAVIFCTAFYMMAGQYKPTEKALESLDSKYVDVTITKDYIFFDGTGTDNALIFYPGGKVDAECYAPLCESLAQNGTDCFILYMPMDFAFLGINKANCVIDNFNYQNWYVGGHSLGGIAASQYANSNDKIDGVLLLASYSTKELKNKDVLTLYGSNDKVLNLDAMKDAKVNLPDDAQFICIQGGNHAQFGSYGFQTGDGEATISQDEQIENVVNEFNKMLNDNV